MLKILGACLVLIGGVWAGKAVGKQLEVRAAALRALTEALRLLRSELDFQHAPLGDLFEELAQRTAPPAAGFFLTCARRLKGTDGSTLSELWRQAAGEELTMLQQGDLEVLLSAGAVLGRYDAENQCRALFAASDRLEKLAEEAEETYRKKGKLYGTLGVSAGAFCAIFLL